jgi:hypothetical protein
MERLQSRVGTETVSDAPNGGNVVSKGIVIHEELSDRLVPAKQLSECMSRPETFKL